MRTFLCIAALIMSSLITLAEESPVTAWGKQYGIALEAFSVAADKSGNCFIAATTGDSLSISYAGKKDVFIRKFDPSGNVLWTINIGSKEDDFCSAIALDPDGNIYVAGKTTGKIAVDNLGGTDAFVVKIDPSGNIIWEKQFGTSNDDEFSYAIIDDQGECYLSGSTRGNFNGTSNGGVDAVFLKLNRNGEILWQKQYGTSTDEKASCIGLDKNNSSYFILSSNEIIKLDKQGNFDKKFNYTMHLAKGIVIDDSLNIYLGGTNGVVEGSKAILIKYNKDFVKQWERVFGSGPWTGINSMAKFKDGTDDILVGVCQNYPSCMGVCRRYNHDGDARWIYTLKKKDINSVCGHSVSIDGLGNSFLTGFTDGNLFDTKVRNQEMFLSKITLSDHTDVNDQNFVPEKRELNQNFPDQVNPSNTISYLLKEPCQVKLTVYDVAGQEIKTLKNTFQNAGEYSLAWDAKDEFSNPVNTGIYFYMLETDKEILQKKMLFVR